MRVCATLLDAALGRKCAHEPALKREGGSDPGHEILSTPTQSPRQAAACLRNRCGRKLTPTGLAGQAVPLSPVSLAAAPAHATSEEQRCGLRGDAGAGCSEEMLPAPAHGGGRGSRPGRRDRRAATIGGDVRAAGGRRQAAGGRRQAAGGGLTTGRVHACSGPRPSWAPSRAGSSRRCTGGPISFLMAPPSLPSRHPSVSCE